MASESIHSVNVARFDDELEVTALGELLIKKLINLSPAAPTYFIESRAESIHFNYKFGEGGRSDSQDRGELEHEVGEGEECRTDGQPAEILDLLEFERLQ